jgi:hypothetical protein
MSQQPLPLPPLRPQQPSQQEQDTYDECHSLKQRSFSLGGGRDGGRRVSAGRSPRAA